MDFYEILLFLFSLRSIFKHAIVLQLGLNVKIILYEEEDVKSRSLLGFFNLFSLRFFHENSTSVEIQTVIDNILRIFFAHHTHTPCLRPLKIRTFKIYQLSNY